NSGRRGSSTANCKRYTRLSKIPGEGRIAAGPACTPCCRSEAQMQPVAPAGVLTVRRFDNGPIPKRQRRSSHMHEAMVSGHTVGRVVLTATLSLWAAVAPASDEDGAFIPRTVNTSSVPANGDLSPYGVAFVPEHFPGGGVIAAGDVLVSNFNSGANVQGTGTTIVQFRPRGPLAP